MGDSKTVDISTKAIDQLAVEPEVKQVLKDLQGEVGATRLLQPGADVEGAASLELRGVYRDDAKVTDEPFTDGEFAIDLGALWAM